jgi:surface antigen
MWSRKTGVTIVAFVVSMSLSLLGSSSVSAHDGVICRSSNWTCDGDLGYNPNRAYWSQYTGHNCTNYVAFRMIRDGAPKYFGPFNGNATVWDDYFKSRGYKVNQKPKVGAIAQWKSWEFGSGGGHVAYVDKVGDNWIIIDEDAWGGSNSRRKIYINDSNWPGRFIHMEKK